MTADAGTLNPATVTEATALRYFGTPVVGYAQLTSVCPALVITLAVTPFFKVTFLELENCETWAVGPGATALLSLTSTMMVGGPFVLMDESLASPAGEYTVSSMAKLFGNGATSRRRGTNPAGICVACGS
jgi:hypothetical protein